MPETTEQEWLDHLAKTEAYVLALKELSSSFPLTADNPNRPLPNKPPIYTGWDHEQ